MPFKTRIFRKILQKAPPGQDIEIRQAKEINAGSRDRLRPGIFEY